MGTHCIHRCKMSVVFLDDYVSKQKQALSMNDPPQVKV